MTLYAALSILVLFSLIAAGLYSARQAAGRVVCAGATEQALFSLFGGYDRELLERYGLLLLDGGYGAGRLRPARLLQEVEEEAALILRPTKGTLFGPRSELLGIRMDREQNSITGYVLATDDNGRAFRRQICEVMQKKLGPAGLLFLRDTLEEQENIARAREAAYAEYAIDESGSLPAIPQEEDGDPQEEDGGAEEDETTASAEIPSWFFDPWQTLRGYHAAGVLALVLPDAAAVSAQETEGAELVSRRTLQSGMQMPADGWEGSGEQLLLLEYLVERFPCYTSEKTPQENTLCYRVEYALAGHTSDKENLQEVLLQMVHLRTAVNFLHILRSAPLRSEAEALAELIALLVANPELQPAITLAIEAAWAYGESVRDLQALLHGGKVPLIKGEDAWDLSLAELPFLRLLPPASGEEQTRGLCYEEYLRLLLFRKNADQLTYALMDLVEMDMRSDYPAFRLDACIDALRVELHTAIGQNTYVVERNYGYNQ